MRKNKLSEILKVYFGGPSLGLPSEQFYKSLDSEFFNYKPRNLWKITHEEYEAYRGICESFNKDHENDWFRKLCLVLLRYIRNANTVTDNQNNDYDDCALLNFWIYERLSLIYNNNYSIITTMFAKLQLLWNTLVSDQIYKSFFSKCNPNFHIHVKNNWRKIKELYDYCVDYQTLYKTAVNFNPNRNYIYRYLKKKAPLYKEFEKNCLHDNNNKCLEFYNKCKEYAPDHVINEIKCIIEKKSNNSHKYELDCKRELGTQSDGVLVDGGDDMLDSLDGLTVDVDLSPSIKGEDEFVGLYVNSETSKTIIILGKTFLGLTLFTILSAILYKYTPIGIQMHKPFRRKKNSINHIDGKQDVLFDYSSGSYNLNYMNGEEYYVGYHNE
ncbi:variable surface protein [Plasmodium gonderi]|uniref:Variable surface protein n=1 Tax=Plasmodium gonderi TaxID=77519 RepID=A0A1Y1JNN8_PLAGO|nr:variable surface protein [Plasmodium gonderi]GAW84079.1 variable surface protein [Plasmodium gonderi]